ncbi:hypothetical protein G6011_00358 [Alternaria panax]|uniref:Uncharacterized protein n=1 Tax=Alternaria panax TaxID=48097 RepID=A0AAD4IIU1_9PLEO|nr:hypothetical protein G6011_00358 [Alternaria panax]
MSASTSTMIEIRDYITNVRYIRRSSSGLGDYDALVSHCFSYFHRNRESYTVHLHFRRNSHCEDGELLRKDQWANGSYEVLFAHFVGKIRIRGQNSLSFGYRARESTTPPSVPSPESPWTQPPLPIVDDQGLPVPVRSSVHPAPDASGPTPTPAPPPPPLASLQPRPATQRRNTNSTTVYSIGPPIPSTHYNATYFSGPYIFIPLRPGPSRPRSHAQRYSDPFPGFRSQPPAPHMIATAITSAPSARARPSARAAISSRSLTSQPQPDDGFPDRPPVTRRGHLRTSQQNVQLGPLARNKFDGSSAACQPHAPPRRARAEQQPASPPNFPDEHDFPLSFARNPPVASQPPHAEHETHGGRQDQERSREEPGRASVESSLESFDFGFGSDDSQVVSQQPQQERQDQRGEQEQPGPEEEGRASVARSQGSFPQFATEKVESPLFVTDESERDFEEDLAWETDSEDDAAAEGK